MNLVQVSVFIENRPGRIAHVAKILEVVEVNLFALSLAETTEYGILRMIVSNPELAMKTLKSDGMTCVSTEVLAVKLDNKPGSVAKVLEIINKHQLNVEYLYAIAEKVTAMVFRFGDIETAKITLKSENVEFICQEDLIL